MNVEPCDPPNTYPLARRVLGRFAPGTRRASGPVPVIADDRQEMKPLRYVAFIGSAALITIGIVMLTRDNWIGMAILMAGAGTCHIGRPAKKTRPFWTGSRNEWIGVASIVFVTVLMLIYALSLPPQLEEGNHKPLSLLEAIFLLGAMFGILGAGAIKERQKCLSERST